MKKISKLIVFIAIITFAVFSQSEVLRLNYNGGNQDITLAPGSKVNVVSSDGRVEVTTNLTAVQIGDLLGVTGTINNPSVNISVSASVLISGSGTAILSWSIADATSCNKTGEWGSGSLATVNGNQSIGPFTGPATKTYGITCQNSLGATASDTVTITITDPNGVNCSVDQPPILAGAEDLTIIANGTASAGSYNGNYDDIQGTAGTNPWPNYGDQIRLSLTRNKYISAAFNSGSLNQTGKLVFNPPGFNEGQSASNVTISISECPGDFSVHLSKPKCLLVGVPSDTFRWSNDPSANSSTYCVIDKNKDYYLNIVNSSDSTNNFSQSSCSTTYCGMLPIQIQVTL
jgi:hypothetical protein